MKHERQSVKAVLRWWGGISKSINRCPNSPPSESIFYRIMADNVERTASRIEVNQAEYDRIDAEIKLLSPELRQVLIWHYRDTIPAFLIENKSTYYYRLKSAETKLAHVI